MFIKKNPTNLLPILVLVSTGLSTISILVQIINVSAVSRLSQKQFMAQLETGETAAMIALDHSQRTPKTIQNFATTVFYMLFTWNNQKDIESVIDIGNPQQDEGVSVSIKDDTLKVPANVALAVHLVAPDFKKELLEGLAPLIPNGVFMGQNSTILLFDSVSEPQEIEKGQWKISLKANLNFFKGKELEKIVPIHKEIFIKSVDVPVIPKGATEQEQAIYGLQLAGLQVFHINDIVQNIPN